MIDQTSMTMGLAEPREATKWENVKVAVKTRLKAIAGLLRASRPLRAFIVLVILGAAFASGWVSSQHFTAPTKLIECPQVPTVPGTKAKTQAAK
jgi:hypothetical protein